MVYENRKSVRKTKKIRSILGIYLRKSRENAEAEKLGEGETLARHERNLNRI